MWLGLEHYIQLPGKNKLLQLHVTRSGTLHSNPSVSRLNICKYVLFSDDGKCVVVTGPAGCGKSALLCKWLMQVKETRNPPVLVYHFIGCAMDSDSKLLLFTFHTYIHLMFKHTVLGTRVH